jgi:hypothetical protein
MAKVYQIPADSLDPMRPNRLLIPLIRSKGLAFYDSTECLTAAGHPADLYYKRDNHFRLAGHRAMADCLIGPLRAFLGE